jgi:hypothetical protein
METVTRIAGFHKATAGQSDSARVCGQQRRLKATTYVESETSRRAIPRSSGHGLHGGVLIE